MRRTRVVVIEKKRIYVVRQGLLVRVWDHPHPPAGPVCPGGDFIVPGLRDPIGRADPVWRQEVMFGDREYIVAVRRIAQDLRVVVLDHGRKRVFPVAVCGVDMEPGFILPVA